jgi:hypothetical protein
MANMLRRVSLTAVTGVGLCLTLLPAGHAQAQAQQAQFRIPCNDIAALKRAIDDANTGGGSIVLAPHCVYSLTAADNADDGLPEITDKVRISGDRSTIQRAPGTATSFRIFHVKQQGTLTLDSVTVRGGDAASSAVGGGGIFNESGRVTLKGVTVRNNSADLLGGGIWNQLGTLVLKHTSVRDNESEIGAGVATNGTTTMGGGALRDNTAGLWGGGLASAARTTLNHASVDGNHAGELGGGMLTLSIDLHTGPLRLNSTRVTNNIAQRQGGGILVGSAEKTTLYRSTVTRNAANGSPGSGGGIRNGAGSLLVALREAGAQRSTKTAPDPFPVNLIRSAVFKNTPDNCAPPNSVPHCDAVGSAPAKNTTRPSGS